MSLFAAHDFPVAGFLRLDFVHDLHFVPPCFGYPVNGVCQSTFFHGPDYGLLAECSGQMGAEPGRSEAVMLLLETGDDEQLVPVDGALAEVR